MKYTPKRHQEIALEFLQTHERCALFLDMGLGKTVVTLTYVKQLLDDFAINKVLVIAPKRVAEDTWTRESDKWEHLSDLRISKVLGTLNQRSKALEKTADIYVINRENVVWLVDYYKHKWPFDLVVIDESSSFKSGQSKRWKALKKVIKLSRYVIELTGTPAPNGYLDLWAQIYLLDGGETLGKTFLAYRATYFTPGAHNDDRVFQWVMRRGAKARIDQALKEFCLSMSKDDWLQLPDIIYNNVIVKMTPSERRIYDKFSEDKILPLLNGLLSEDPQDAESAVIGSTAAVASGKLLQLANGAVYDDDGNVFHVHDQKISALEELTESGNNLLVFYSYKHDLDRLKKAFPNAKEMKTSEDMTKWNKGEISMMLVHPASAAYGLNIQEGGHTIVWFGLPWSLELYQQANARLYRQGQEHSVIVHHIICDRTMDEKVLSALQSKDASQRSLLEALKDYVHGI